MVHGLVFQSYLFRPILDRERLNVFPRPSTKSNRNFEVAIPPWALAGRLQEACLSPQMLFEMMTTSIVFYEVETFIEKSYVSSTKIISMLSKKSSI